MVVPMLRPDVFGALASHAGDALFECCYLPNFPQLARKLRDDFDGSLRRVLRASCRRSDRLDMERFENFDLTATPRPTRPTPSGPGKALLPFDVATGRLIDDVWAQWLDKDPVRMAPRHADALRSMRRVYLDAGKQRRVLPRPRRAGVRAPSSTSSASSTRSSCSTASTAGSPTATRARSASSCWRYGDRGRPRARRHRRHLPADLGADQARARAAGARRGRWWCACPPGEALENVPRSAAEAGHDVSVEGTRVRIVRR